MSYSPAAEAIGLPRLGEKFEVPNKSHNDEQIWVTHDDFDIEA